MPGGQHRDWYDEARQPHKEKTLLTESQVEKSFRSLMSTGERTEETFDKAEEMLDELRCESPLRHRLSVELEELRALASSKS